MRNSAKWFLLLHLILGVYASSSVCSKLAAQQPFLSVGFILLYGGMLAALVVLCAVLRVRQGPPTLGQGKFPWWTWTGGLLGAVYVLANIYLSGILGTGMTVIILLVGATAGGAVIDHFGLLGAARKSLTVRKVVGILGMLAGAAAIKLF